MDTIRKHRMEIKNEAAIKITKWKTQMQNQQIDMISLLKMEIFKPGKCQLYNLKRFLRNNLKIKDIKYYRTKVTLKDH